MLKSKPGAQSAVRVAQSQQYSHALFLPGCISRKGDGGQKCRPEPALAYGMLCQALALTVLQKENKPILIFNYFGRMLN